MGRIRLSITLFILFCWGSLSSQNCTVNAGIDGVYCLGDSITLNGFRAGSLSGGSQWSQISGPSLIINSPNSLVTGISGKVAGTFVFNLRNRCQDGSNANDQITITIKKVSIANAGADQTICPGNGTLSANQPGPGEKGKWTIESNYQGVIINNDTLYNSGFTTVTGNGGISTLKWVITNSNGCQSSDTMRITDYGGVEPVTTLDSMTLTQCYSVFTSTVLNGSFSGTGLGGQKGEWQTISGPNNPSLVNSALVTAGVSGLVQGIYYFEYSVSGPCANGKDTIKVIVPPPLGVLSPSGGTTIYLCDRPTTYVLTAQAPVFVNDISYWNQVSGPTAVTFSPDSSPVTTVSGLDGKGGSIYQFSYTMFNPVSNCIQNNLWVLRYVDTPTLTVERLRILSCDQDTVHLRYIDTGGRITTISQLSGPGSVAIGNMQSDSFSHYTEVSNLSKTGTYEFKIRRSAGTGQACTSVEEDIRVITSFQPSPANAGSSQRLNCGVDTTQLAGNIPGAGAGHWYQNSGPNQSLILDSLNNITTIRNLIAGRYEYRWIVEGGPRCFPTQDDVRVLVADTVPGVSAAGSDQTVCFNSILHLQGNQPNPGNSGVWSVVPDSGIVFADSTQYLTTARGMDSLQTYQFIWRIYNPCGSAADTLMVTITSNVAAIPADAGDDRCLPDTTSFFLLDGNDPSPGFGLWKQISGPSATITDDSLYNTSVIPSGSGTYIFEWNTGNSLCEAGTDTVVITLSDTVTRAFAGFDRDTCSNHLILNGNTPVYGKPHWTLRIGRINGHMLYPDSSYTPVLSLSQGSYVYRYTIDNGACGISHDDVRINIANPVTPPLASVGRVWCSPASISINANRITSGKGYWSLNGLNPGSPMFAQKDSASTTVSGLVAGIYSFKWNSVNTLGICPDLSSNRYDTVVMSAYAGPDRILCKVYNQQLDAYSGSKGYWRQVAGDTVVIDTTGDNTAVISGLTSNGSPFKFVFEVNPSYGCPQNIDTVQIEVFDSTRTPFAGTDQMLCDADTFHLDANSVSPDAGRWYQNSGPNTGSFENTSDPETRFYNVSGGSYLLEWRSSNRGCVKSDFVLIRNYDSSVSSFAGNDTSICPPYAMMDANFTGGNSAIWQQISGPNQAVISSGVNPKTRISGLIKGDYAFEWVITNGYCPSTRDTVTIQVPYDEPDQAMAGRDTVLCDADSFVLSGNNPLVGKGTWTQISGFTTTFSNDTVYNTWIHLNDTGASSHEWRINNGNCFYADTIKINNRLTPALSPAQPDSGFCLYQPVFLSAQTPLFGQGRWQEISNLGAFILNPNSATTALSGMNAGHYQFRWVVSNGICSSASDTVSISIDSIPSLSDAGPDVNTCLSRVMIDAVKPLNGTGHWSYLSGKGTPVIRSDDQDTSLVSSLDSGRYAFEWEVATGGCSNRDTMNVVLSNPPVNDQCLQPIMVQSPGGSYYGDLCGAWHFGAEPNTTGFGACNTIFYKFRTSSGNTYVKTLNIDVSSMNNCPTGVKFSLYDSADCPGLGLQHDTGKITTGAGQIVFDSLKSNNTYILVIDEFKNPCDRTLCNLSFNLSGTALPVNVFDFDVTLNAERKAMISWYASDDAEVLFYEVRRRTSLQELGVGSIKASGLSVINSYLLLDATVGELPAEYLLFAHKKNGDIKKLATKVLFEPGGINPFVIYPNPNNGSFSLQCNESENHRNVQVSIFDAGGQKLYSDDMSFLTGNQTLVLQNPSPGLYSVMLESNGKIWIFRLVVN